MSVSRARSAAIAGARLQLMARRRVRLAEKELRDLERQVRWLYAADGHALGYPVAHSPELGG